MRWVFKTGLLVFLAFASSIDLSQATDCTEWFSESKVARILSERKNLDPAAIAANRRSREVNNHIRDLIASEELQAYAIETETPPQEMKKQLRYVLAEREGPIQDGSHGGSFSAADFSPRMTTFTPQQAIAILKVRKEFQESGLSYVEFAAGSSFNPAQWGLSLSLFEILAKARFRLDNGKERDALQCCTLGCSLCPWGFTEKQMERDLKQRE